MIEQLVVVGLLRFFVPFLILRFPFYGVIFSLLLDLFDVVLLHVFGAYAPENYHFLDKIFDTWYLLIAFFVSLRWTGLEKKISIGLFVWRVVGFLAFEFTGVRWLLFFAPNVFEFWFIVVEARNKWFKSFVFTLKNSLFILLALLCLKLFHEWVLHVGKLCEKPYLNACGLEKYPPLKWFF